MSLNVRTDVVSWCSIPPTELPPIAPVETESATPELPVVRAGQARTARDAQYVEDFKNKLKTAALESLGQIHAAIAPAISALEARDPAAWTRFREAIAADRALADELASLEDQLTRTL